VSTYDRFLAFPIRCIFNFVKRLNFYSSQTKNRNCKEKLNLPKGSDEFHQFFVPGRKPMLSDVEIDSVATGLGLMVGYVMMNFKYEKVKTYRRLSELLGA
jgi:hypothetical protein